MPYPTDPQLPAAPAAPTLDWKQALMALGPMVAAGFAGQGTGMGAFGENYARGAAVAEELQQRNLAMQQREQELAWRKAEAERQRVDQENEQAFKLLEYYPKLRDQALDLAEKNGLYDPALMAQHAAGTMKDYHTAITQAFPFMAKHAGLLESMGAVTPQIASTRLREKMRPYYEKIRESVGNDEVQLQKLRQSLAPLTPWQVPFAQLEAVVGMAGVPGKRDQESAIYREWKEYTQEGGKLTFDQYMTMDANRKRPVTNLNMQSGMQGGLTPDAVEFAGTQFRITGVMPPLGQGSKEARAAILNEAARQAKALGKTPAAAIQAQAAFQADKSSLAKIRLLSSSAAAFEQKAIAQSEIIRDLSAKVGRTAWPIINEGLLAWKKNVAGDRDTQLLYNAILTYASEYGKIIEGSTGSAAGSTDSARKAAAELISPALAKGTLPSTLDLMNREMGLTMQGYDAVIGHITKRMTGEEGYEGSQPKRETVVVPGGIPDGTPVVFPDNSPGYWDANLGRAVRGVKK